MFPRQIVLAFALSTASAYFLADTPDVAAAKQQFYQAYNQAARAAQAASPYAEAHQPNNVPADADPGQVYPEAVPYVHVDIPAEPYVHMEPPRRRGGKPVAQPVQPAYQPQQPAYQQAYNYQVQPQQPAYNTYINNPQYNTGFVAGPWTGQCYNNLGEGVDCRTDFSENLGYY